MNNPKYREKVLIGLENAPPSFNVRGKVVGPNGANLQYITNETGAIVTIRGRGSGYIEPTTGQESFEPLHICIEHSKYEVLQAGRQLAFNLIDTVQQEWSNLQHQMQQEQQQQQNHQQQPQSQQQPTPSVVSSTNSGVSQTMVSNEVAPTITSVAPPSSVSLPAGFSQQAVGQMITVPPPTHVTIPPPTLHIPPQLANPQVATSTSNGTLVGHTPENNQSLVPAGNQNSGQEVPVSQGSAQPPTISIPAQQQLFLSNQGAILQPQTLIPQQQQIITPTGQVITAQPQVLAQSYLLQYMQTNSGQMVLSYPNMVRPAGATGDGRGQQLMLVQYGDGGAIKTSAVRAPAPQPPQATVPQVVQIVNPQTGQIQHVLQHIQPQIQMPQAQLQHQILGQGGGILGQQVLMPIQAPIQFTSQPQQMIITQPPPQLQQQILPSGQTLQQVIPTSTLNQVSTPVSINVSQKQIVLNIAKQQQQGLKRRFEGDHQPLSIMDAHTANQIQNKKGIGNLWLVSTADGTTGLAQTVCSPTYRFPTSVNLGVPAINDTLLIQSGDLSLQNSQMAKADGISRPSNAPQQEILVQSGDKNQYGQDDWRRSSPLVSESSDARNDPSSIESSKRGRMTQNGQGNELSAENRNDPPPERYAVAKVEGQNHNQPPPQIYNVTAVPQQQQVMSVQRPQQAMQHLYQTGNLPPQAQAPPQQAQGPPGSAAQLPPGSYAQQMYHPPPLPTSTAQVGAAPQQYVSPPMYNTMPPQQSYAAAPYNPWILPS